LEYFRVSKIFQQICLSRHNVSASQLTGPATDVHSGQQNTDVIQFAYGIFLCSFFTDDICTYTFFFLPFLFRCIWAMSKIQNQKYWTSHVAKTV